MSTSTEERPRHLTGACAPSRSYEQRMTALERANAVRLERARLKREIKLTADVSAGRRGAVALLRSPPPEVATMKVEALLLAIPQYGDVKVKNLLSKLAISPSKTIGGLSRRQRLQLVDALEAGEAVGSGRAER